MISELRTVPGHIVHAEHAVWQPTVIVQSHLLSCTNVVLRKIGVSGVSASMTERTARELEHEEDRTRSRSSRGSRIGEGGRWPPATAATTATVTATVTLTATAAGDVATLVRRVRTLRSVSALGGVFRGSHLPFEPLGLAGITNHSRGHGLDHGCPKGSSVPEHRKWP